MLTALRASASRRIRWQTGVANASSLSVDLQNQAHAESLTNPVKFWEEVGQDVAWYKSPDKSEFSPEVS